MKYTDFNNAGNLESSAEAVAGTTHCTVFYDFDKYCPLCKTIKLNAYGMIVHDRCCSLEKKSSSVLKCVQAEHKYTRRHQLYYSYQSQCIQSNKDYLFTLIYTVSQKTRHSIVTIISSNLNRFSKFFHRWKRCQISYETKHYPPHLKCVAALPRET